jgi:hypothetical protein
VGAMKIKSLEIIQGIFIKNKNAGSKRRACILY